MPRPEWHEIFEFRVSCCELAMLTVSVFDKDALIDDFLGAYALPVRSIRDGYRVLPLTRKNVPLPESALLCHFELTFEKEGARDIHG
jgi:hypothetical protein